MAGFFTAVFWKEAWIWCKVNWKFILGLSIPIILSIIARRGNMKKILQASLKAREQELEIERRAAGLETKLKDEATDEFVDAVNRVHDNHEAALIDLADERRKREGSITDPSDATRELADKFDLENQDED
jgi:hypothetical protein